MRTALSLLASLAASLAFTSSSQAYLGSFGPNDGYYAQYGTVLGDVTYYNAGQSGINAGGGSAVALPADTGLWSLQTPANGGVFNNVANRAVFTANYPAYPPTPANTAPIYLLGGHFPGHNNDGYNLAFRNDTALGSGAARYRYALDTYDFGGLTPASVTSGPLSMGFYFLPNPADAPSSSGGRSDVKFTMSILDSNSKVGFEWGYARDNTVLWRTSPSNPWNYTSVTADQTNWDGVRFDMDLTASTFGIDYYDVGTNTWSNLVPAGTPMGFALLNFTHIDWQLEDGVNTGLYPTIAGKNYFDDFSVSVPEPSVLGMAMLPVAGMIRRRRRAGV